MTDDAIEKGYKEFFQIEVTNQDSSSEIRLLLCIC